MTYSDAVKWEEVQAVIRHKMAEQPRGYQARLAKELGITPGYISHFVTGHKVIPPEFLEPILESLDLTYDIVLHDVPKPPLRFDN